MSDLKFEEENFSRSSNPTQGGFSNNVFQEIQKTGGVVGILYKIGLAKDKHQANVVMFAAIILSWIIIAILILKFIL